MCLLTTSKKDDSKVKMRWLKHLTIFFVNVAKYIGKDSCAVNQEHPSVKVISEDN
jgi:hypothetical protein